MLFSNDNYFSYCTFIIITIVSSFYLLDRCGGLINTKCHQLLIGGHIALIFIIIESIKYTKMSETPKNTNMIRYIIDSIFLLICFNIIFTYRINWKYYNIKTYGNIKKFPTIV